MIPLKISFGPGMPILPIFTNTASETIEAAAEAALEKTAARVAAGAVAKLLLKELDIEIQSGISEIGGIKAKDLDFDFAKKSIIRALDASQEKAQIETIKKVKEEHDSVGGAVLTIIKGAPIGLGEPLYYKLDSILAEAMMSINAVKAVEIGDGMEAARVKGSQNNDPITTEGFGSNHSGGILGGISNGDDIVIKSYFKPTPSIFQSQDTVNTKNEKSICNLKGRHDPCVAVRGSIVCEAMAALVLADMILLNCGKKMTDLQKIYR